MVAALWMLAWLGFAAGWQRRSFWTAENLLASVFYGSGAIRGTFSSRTVSGLALYLLVYSLLGCAFGATFRRNLARARLALAGMLIALGWYYLSFHLIWPALSPLIPLLYATQATVLGHVIYGGLLARYPSYLPREEKTPEPEMVPVLAVEETAQADSLPPAPGDS